MHREKFRNQVSNIIRDIAESNDELLELHRRRIIFHCYRLIFFIKNYLTSRHI